MLKTFLLVALLVISCLRGTGQFTLNRLTINSSHTSFPDTGRMKGHVYDSVLYNAAEHYSDSSVIIIVPQHLMAVSKVDIVFWFHGWHNNINNALTEYGLERQFAEAGMNAILVLAETTKNAPDSYGGKLEQQDQFRQLVNDVLQKLAIEHVISTHAVAGNIMLAGHSGAYRVMAHILQNGNLAISEVILFDALYSQTDKYLNWIHAGSDHRFINIYTNNGGTYDETKNMMQQLNSMHVDAASLEEPDVNDEMLRKNRIIFIHTQHEHNYIIQHPDNFKMFLQNSPSLKKLKP